MTSVIIGYGYVGQAMHRLIPDARFYDPYIKVPSIQSVTSEKEVNQFDIAFICVPTPLRNSKLDTSIVEKIVSWCNCPLIVIRSTLNPGDTERFVEKYDKHIIFQPELLGETPNHPMNNQKDYIILGGLEGDRRWLINFYTKYYNASVKIRQVSSYEAEVIKLSSNRAAAFKIAEFQELYDACEAHGVDYYTIRDIVYGDDPRFELWWSFIYETRGFHSSKCLRKDPEAWCAWAESAGFEPVLTKKIIEWSKQWEQLSSAGGQGTSAPMSAKNS